MSKSVRAAYLASIAVDPSAPTPLYRQLYFNMRDAILEGRLKPGARLPATRPFATDLAVSRNTVVTAFDQLLAEGYIEGRTGAGTYVSRMLPEDLLVARRTELQRKPRQAPPRLSRRGAVLAAIRPGGITQPRAFSPRFPEMETFPFEDWARLLSRRWRNPTRRYLVDSDTAGYRPLREAIAHYLGVARAVQCDPEQILIVSGSQQALDIATRALIDPGDSVWVEDPGYAGTVGALTAAGAELTPVPIDGEGLDVQAGRFLRPDARLACVSPSHQYPLGVVMTLRRRLALLDWARSADAFILEDDYDSEYRYAGRPLTPLRELDSDGRVIYLGSLSKVMFPSLRMGYMMVPESLVDPLRAIRALVDFHPSAVPQAALADFIGEGYLATHIRRMRTLYAERQKVMITAANEHLPDLLTLSPDEAGMHLVGYLRSTANGGGGGGDNEIGAPNDRAAMQCASDAGITTAALSSYYHTTPDRAGLLLGYAGVPSDEIKSGMSRLAVALRHNEADWRNCRER
ncbi:MAG: GntR family transcriptional regulator/MocR family aminotransferase [Alphaproteobacteria bacterium]|jgi:GntR family transcriptional regulator/MocR family aminotransferase